MGKILDQIQSTYYPDSIITGPKQNCLITPNNTIIKETRFSPGMAQMGYHGHGNELHKFTFYNEIKWLTILESTPFTPQVKSYNEDLLTIEMSYAGVPLNKNNVPANWYNQCVNILDTLRQNNCSHNDIKPEDILVLDNKLCLVDFGWATNLDESIPDNWPTTIGGNYKFTPTKFNDSYSLLKSLNSILNE